jgi:hypothetical protein
VKNGFETLPEESAKHNEIHRKSFIEGERKDYSKESTIVGWSVFTSNKYIYCIKIGKLVFVYFLLEGTSNLTAITFTVPYTSANKIVYCGGALLTTKDAGTLATSPGRVFITPNTNIVTCQKDCAAGAWTNSGDKQVQGQFWYEADE